MLKRIFTLLFTTILSLAIFIIMLLLIPNFWYTMVVWFAIGVFSARAINYDWNVNRGNY